jgi:hypothetical protein
MEYVALTLYEGLSQEHEGEHEYMAAVPTLLYGVADELEMGADFTQLRV